MHDPTLAQAFFALTPETVLDAVEVGGRRCTGRFLVLNSYENRVYQFELEAADDEDERRGGRGPRLVGKFYRPGRWSRAAVQAEHDFLAELAAEGVPVASPLALRPGEPDTVGDIPVPGGVLHYALFPSIGGRAAEEPSDAQLATLGRLLARMHTIGAAAPASERPRLTPETYGRENLAYLSDSGALPAEVRPQYVATVEALVDRMEPRFRDVPLHRIHADCHLGNLLVTPQGPTFLDFDDFRVGPAVQDVWLLAPSADAEGARQRRVIADAYAELRDFDPAWLRLVEPLRALRFVHYSAWLSRRTADGDPHFARAFPHFGTLTYWQREVQDLREQIARLDAED